MRDVWIYAAAREGAAELTSALAELGFGARYAGDGARLVPRAAGGSIGRPLLAAVAVSAEDGPGAGLVGRLRASDDLGHVPILLAAAPGALPRCDGLDAADELIVAPYSLPELETRIARATRAGAAGDARAIRVGALELDP